MERNQCRGDSRREGGGSREGNSGEDKNTAEGWQIVISALRRWFAIHPFFQPEVPPP